MPDNSMVKKVYEWSPTLTRSLGRPENRWEDDVKSDITRMKVTNWKDCIGNRIKWKKLVEKAKTSLKVLCLKKKNRMFSVTCHAVSYIISLSRTLCLSWVSFGCVVAVEAKCKTNHKDSVFPGCYTM
jgi:hypothetical protein